MLGIDMHLPLRALPLDNHSEWNRFDDARAGDVYANSAAYFKAVRVYCRFIRLPACPPIRHALQFTHLARWVLKTFRNPCDGEMLILQTAGAAVRSHPSRLRSSA